MKEKISDNIKKEMYSQKLPSVSFDAYIKSGKWTDYLLSDKIIFSHRSNTCRKLADKLHAHDFYELFILGMGEELEYISDEGKVLLRRGMAILTKPNQFHALRLTTPGNYDRYIIYFRNLDGLFPDKRIFDLISMGNQSCAVFELPEHTMLSYMEAIERALSNTASPYSCAKAILGIFELLLALSEQNVVSESTSHLFPFAFISEIKKYIDENFLSIHSVEDLTEQFFYSREYISRSFKQYYNTPIYEYILGRKMLNCEMLLKQGASVETAAHASGFHNMSSFFKLFRKMNGCTPSEYRQKFSK